MLNQQYESRDRPNSYIYFATPLSATLKTVRSLIFDLQAQIQAWKNKILDAVGENAQVIIEVIPELERIIGKQPPAPDLSATAAQNRFNLLFQKFTPV
ncbi:hypothetical protein [Nostoc sp.]|uniref:hypothetical protein n=1 Tax=Nostoc sp. TaxID=1180 RepID=UPI002FFA8A38